MPELTDLVKALPATIGDSVAGALPEKTSVDERAGIAREVQKAVSTQTIELLEAARDREVEFNRQVDELQGTTKDLLAGGLLGRIALFLRGLQRPVWGYAVLGLDFMVFSGAWKVKLPDEVLQKTGDASTAVVSSGLDIEMVFWTINLLVLGFLFGERAVKNVLPAIQNLRASAAQQPPG